MELKSEHQATHEKAVSLSRIFRKTEAELVETLMEIDKEKIYLALGYSSLFSYAVESLQLSEANAYAFMSVARKAREIPELKKEIVSGNLSVSKAKRIVPILTKANQNTWIPKASQMSKADLEKEVAKEHPETLRREFIRAVSEDRFLFRLDISDALLRKIKRAQTLGSNKKRETLSLEQSLEMVVDEFLNRNDPLRKEGKRTGSSSNNKVSKISDGSQLGPGTVDDGKDDSRASGERVGRIPLSPKLRNAIFKRDKHRCQFQQKDGTICGTNFFVEIHHRKQVSEGGTNDPQNLIVLCGRHHQFWHDHLKQRVNSRRDAAENFKSDSFQQNPTRLRST